MIKSQIIEEVAKKANTTKKNAREVIDLFLEEVKKALARGIWHFPNHHGQGKKGDCPR